MKWVCLKNEIQYFPYISRKLSIYDEWSSLKIHVAMDNTVVTEEIGIIF